MARLTTKNYHAALEYPYGTRYPGSFPFGAYDHDYANNRSLTFSDFADTTSIFALKVDTDNFVELDSAAVNGADQAQSFYFPTAGALVTQTFFVATRPMRITSIREIHSTAETATGTATLAVFKDTGVTAPGTGATTMVGAFNLKGAANTLQNATLLAVDGGGQPNTGIILATGDRLSIVVGGTATLSAEAGVQLTLTWEPGAKETDATYFVASNSTIATGQTFFLANRDYQVTSVQAIWSAAGGTSSTLDVTQETGTTAPAGGTTILSTPIVATTTANTTNVGSLTATAANLIVRAGNRLSFKLAGTKGSLAGVCIVVQMQAIGAVSPQAYVGQVDLMWANTTVATEAFFIADRDYEAVDFSATFSTASGGGGTLDLTIDKGVVAPGAGTSALSGTVTLAGTANTVVVAGLSSSRRNKLLNQGDVLSVKVTSPSATAGLAACVSLLPR